MIDPGEWIGKRLVYAETALNVEGKAFITFPDIADKIAKKWSEEYRSGECSSLYGVRPIMGRPNWYEAFKIV